MADKNTPNNTIPKKFSLPTEDFATLPREYNEPLLDSKDLTGETTKEQRLHFREKGYIVLNNFVDEEICSEMLERAKLLSKKEMESRDQGQEPETRWQVTMSQDRLNEKNLEPYERVSKIFRLHGPRDTGIADEFDIKPVFEPWSRNLKLLNVLTDLFGDPAITCFLSQFIFKNGARKNSGGRALIGSIGQPSHQDTFYFLMDQRQIGVWIALTDATEENGCLSVVSGSHTDHVHSVSKDQRPHAQLGYIEILKHPVKSHKEKIFMKKGDVLFFDANIIHGSTDNLSSDPRYTMLYHFTPSFTKYKSLSANMYWSEVQTYESFSMRNLLMGKRAKI